MTFADMQPRQIDFAGLEQEMPLNLPESSMPDFGRRPVPII
jgi:hypothetical protein